jgi:hypothetical protein
MGGPNGIFHWLIVVAVSINLHGYTCRLLDLSGVPFRTELPI